MKKRITFLPFSDHVSVKPADRKTMTDGGIFLPESQEADPVQYGTVVACGPDVQGIKAGDNVIWGKYDGVAIDIDGTKGFMLKLKSIVSKYEITDAPKPSAA